MNCVKCLVFISNSNSDCTAIFQLHCNGLRQVILLQYILTPNNIFTGVITFKFIMTGGVVFLKFIKTGELLFWGVNIHHYTGTYIYCVLQWKYTLKFGLMIWVPIPIQQQKNTSGFNTVKITILKISKLLLTILTKN